MQPFDALTMRAVLQEARPLLVNRRIEKIFQLGRDEILLAMRLKTGGGYFLLSAQAASGRLCMVANPTLPKHVNPPAFCQLLRKHLSGATLLDARQLAGERVADFTFGCTDELGTRSTKVLTAEIMGRHSNLIFWDKQTEKIIGASHVVTAEMSRHREVAPGLRYIRPPMQDKPSLFSVSQNDFGAALRKGMEIADGDVSWESLLLAGFSGTGRHLAEEVCTAAGVSDKPSIAGFDKDCAALWQKIAQLQSVDRYKPCMRMDLTRYTVLSWWPELRSGTADGWKCFPAVNDMVDEYFRTLQQREQMQQLRDRIRAELKSEKDKLQTRLDAAEKQLTGAEDLSRFKLYGDSILANVSTLESGQSQLVCDDLFANDGSKLTIELNPNLSPAQNAQHYYRQFAKARVRQQAATSAITDVRGKMATVDEHMQALDSAKGAEELARLKEVILDRNKRIEQKPQSPKQQQQPSNSGPTQAKSKLMSTKSSDGWLIYLGRNKHENELLISKIANPADIWLHVQGQGGAHVLIKNPNKQDPPGSTLREAAQLAARFSKISLGSKVRVVYTYVKYVKKIGGKDKPGLVRYENERTIEVDTSQPMPPSLRKLFAR